MQLNRFIYLVLFLGIHICWVASKNETARPFYLFGHMANSIREVQSALAAGANAIEADVQFGITGRPVKVYHGSPCDCFRDCSKSEQLSTYLAHVKKYGELGNSLYNPKMAILYLDLKLGVVLRDYLFIAGHRLGEMLLLHFFQGGLVPSRINVIIGIQSVDQQVALHGFLKAFLPKYYYLLRNIGFDVSGIEDLKLVHNMFFRLRLHRHAWQGDGITNCLPHSDHRLREVLYMRDTTSDLHVNKVYAWTVDNKANMKSALRLNVDAIMTNEIASLKKILAEREFRDKFYIATNEDDPWKKIIGSGPLRYGCEQDTCWKDCDVYGNWCWTNFGRCNLIPERCKLDLTCSGPCGTRFLYLQTFGKALFHSLTPKSGR